MGLGWLVLALLVLLTARELFQMLMHFRKYISSLENWLEIALIVVTGSLVLVADEQSAGRQQLSAIAILLSWAELVLLIGRHPQLATNIEMFKTVSVNFLKFLAWYSLLIVAFALSFYTLFKDCGGTGCKEEDGEENFFLTPGMSVFKSIVMLTGEFDAGSIPFVSFPGTSHVLFVLFVFLIAIVLFNLLNGLAVSDTQAIRADAELVAYVSRINLVAYFESLRVGRTHRKWQKWLFSFCFSHEKVTTCVNLFPGYGFNLFPELIPKQQIQVLPNQCNQIQGYALPDSCCGGCRRITMDRTVMRDVRELFLKRNANTEVNQMEKMIEYYKQQLQLSGQRIEHLEKVLLDHLKNREHHFQELQSVN